MNPKIKIKQLAQNAWEQIGATRDPLDQLYREGLFSGLKQSYQLPISALQRLTREARIEARRQWLVERNGWSCLFYEGLGDGYSQALAIRIAAAAG